MEIDKDILDLIRQNQGTPLVIQEGEVIQEDYMEAYNRLLEKGLVPELCTLDKDGNVVPATCASLSKEDFK